MTSKETTLSQKSFNAIALKETSFFQHHRLCDFYDVCVIGGGPGGYVAALEAAAKGLSVALVEKEALGGTCLQWGCIPTKTLLHEARHQEELRQTLKELKELSLEKNLTPQQKNPQHIEEFFSHILQGKSLESMVQHSRDVVTTLEKGLHYLYKKKGVVLYKGTGCLKDPKSLPENFFQDLQAPLHGIDVTITLDSTTSTSSHSAEKTPYQPSSETKIVSLFAHTVILATGSRPRRLPFPQHLLWTSKEAMSQHHIPQKLLIIGAGVIGLEFACMYQALGTEVTLVEYADTFLEREEKECRDFFLQSLKKRGLRFFFSHEVLAIDEDIKEDSHYFSKKKVLVSCRHSKESWIWEGDAVLGAIGVQGNTQHLNLEAYDLQPTSQGFLEVWGPSMRLMGSEGSGPKNHHENQHNGKKNLEGLYAIGDLTGNPCLAHKASAQGLGAARDILWRKKKFLGYQDPYDFLKPLDQRSAQGSLENYILFLEKSLENKSVQEQGVKEGMQEQGEQKQRNCKKSWPQEEAPQYVEKPLLIPGCLYTFPQMASVGLTKAQCAKEGLDILWGCSFFHGNGAALAQNQGEGLVVTIFDKKSQRLLGGHLVGPQSSELISVLALGIHLKATAQDLLSMVFPHPSLSEALGESILQAFGQDLHS